MKTALVFLAVHILCLLLVYSIGYSLEFFTAFPNELGLNSWDASWYQRVATEGYHFSSGQQSNAGFFPGFPFLWNVTHLGVMGISLFNFILSLISALILARSFRFQIPQLMLMLSLPASFFLFVPYTEALFFFSCTLCLTGWQRERFWLFLSGILLASLTRASGIFLIPALCGVLLIQPAYSGPTFKRTLRYCLSGIGMVALGTAIVLLIQYLQTGEPFAYFKAQTLFWERSFHFPQGMFTTWGGMRMIWIDGISLFLGLGAIFLWIRQFFRRRKAEITTEPVVFSLGYLGMVAISIIFFNPQPADGSTTLFGISRYMLAVPFLWIAADHYLFRKRIVLNAFLITAAILLMFWLSFGSWRHIQQFLYWMTVSVYLLLYLVPGIWPKLKFTWIIIYLVNLSAMCWLFDSFLNGIWVG